MACARVCAPVAELMHAWLRLNGALDLDKPVEEGLCQLIAFLWLQMQQVHRADCARRVVPMHATAGIGPSHASRVAR